MTTTRTAERIAYERSIIPTPPVPDAALYEANAWHATTQRFPGRHVAVPVCGSTGPRIEDVRPRCGQDLGHEGFHRGFLGSGFEHEQWSGPLLRDEDFALSYRGPRG